MDALKLELEALLRDYRTRLASAHTEQELRKAFADFGGSAGSIRTAQKNALKTAPGPQKREIGQITNAVMTEVEADLERRLGELKAEADRHDLERSVDVTLPGRRRPIGHLHPITTARREIERIFAQLGFTVAEGPQVETEFHNFDALAIPADHPSRDMMDTFFVEDRPGVVLRTHTSPVQIRTMVAAPPPVRIIAPGAVYRKDDDPTHSPMFTQVEGLCVDGGVSGRHIHFGHLKGTLLHFARRFFGESMDVRLRPSFFPFTEPSAEIDFACPFCQRDGSACRTCKSTGWIEIGGAGMVDPDVFEQVCSARGDRAYDPEQVSGFAFGWGIDRMAMLRYGIPDIKQLFEGDVRLVRQFR